MRGSQEKPEDIETFISAGLHKTRLNLLDLSGRNRLLNFKHTGSKILRIVDEIPNQIYNELLANSEREQKGGFTLSPVPLPKKTDYPDLEDKKSLQNIDVKSHAKKLGISTAWEMKSTANSDEEKHQDDKLQTLLYPEDLDRLVRRIQSEAKTAIEESGVNMLFLCLGFLKWSDTKNSDVFSHAPLIMIPIEVERDKRINSKTGFANFKVRYTGEDILDNICLREKLKQFAIELPSFEEFEEPESYFLALEAILKDIKPDWSIERFVTASFLSFGKMLMYLDLDPSRWPDIGGLSDSQHIRDIFTGSYADDGTTATEFDIDTDKNLPKLPHVMDADSSQHSAIIDVLKGKSIVIEGPPGTGKSQTITNLIAACLAEGKTVLFVAEKLAALQVVRKRLDNVGLGNFCLELHSHKTQKKAMMADLKKRLDMNSNAHRKARAVVEERLSDLQQNKRKLIEYSTAINTPFGATEETPHQIFWKTDVLQKELAGEYKAEAFITPKNVTSITVVTLRKQLATIKDLVDKLKDYFGGEFRVSSHFWQGLNFIAPTDYALQQDIFQGFQRLSKAASVAQAAIVELKNYSLQELPFDNFRKMSGDLSSLKEDDFSNAHLFQKLGMKNLSEDLKDASTKLHDYISETKNYSKLLSGYGVNASQVEKFCDQVPLEEIRIPESVVFQELKDNLETLNKCIGSFERATPVLKEAMVHLKLDHEKPSLDTLRAVKRAAEICASSDISSLSSLNLSVEGAIGSSLLSDLLATANKLRSEQDELRYYFELANLPSIERLKQIQQELHEKPLLGFLSSKWRATALEFRRFVANKKENDYKRGAIKIGTLIQHLSAVDAFSNNSSYNTMLPGLFKGMDTDINALKNVISFYEELRKSILSIRSYSSQIYASLKGQDRLVYEWFTLHKGELLAGLQALETAEDMFAGKGDSGAIAPDVFGLVEKVKKSISEFRRIEQVIIEADMPMTINLQQLKELKNLAQMLRISGEELKRSALFKQLNLSISEEKLDTHASLLSQLTFIFEKISRILPIAALPSVLCGDGFKNSQIIGKYVTAICQYLEAQESLRQYIPELLNLKDFWDLEKEDEIHLLCIVQSKLVDIDSHRESFDKWCDIANSFLEIKTSGYDNVIHSIAQYREPPIPFSRYAPLYTYLVYNALSEEVLRQNKVLGSFARISHENVRNTFREIDLELQKLNSEMLAYEISRRSVPEGSGGRSTKEFTDATLIRHEVGKQKAHIPIRKLVARAYDALAAMKPCFMMGPLSVAQYLAPGNEKFDVLIMDEASQVKPEDAIGILARAKQVVVVGDSNQLPPTGFFDTLGEAANDDEDATIIEDSESILDVCKPIFQPIRRLRWHYRSQHQSLISFSNHHFYDNDLVVFPSPTAHSDTIGVKHVYVADGVYSSQSNPIEAARLVQDIIQMTTLHPQRSYGIVTLNAKQKILIEDEIERVRKDNPVFDKFVSDAEQTDEELFVKNLENVQGDERDVIFISTTFGPDENGAFRQNFGPINGKNGWRRLNVLFTRAKQHVRIFSSFHGDRIKVDDTKEQRGLRALKDYLQYAATGIDNHSYTTGKEPDSDFERAVGSFLRNKGYEVVYQLGVAGYLIDMVVRHPRKNSEYIIAIECDGAAYHSAKSARDRDRLREENLRKLGWGHIHRIWSTDWFKRRQQEEARLLDAVEAAINDHDHRFSKQ